MSRRTRWSETPCRSQERQASRRHADLRCIRGQEQLMGIPAGERAEGGPGRT
jgi:hypothetical protein